MVGTGEVVVIFKGGGAETVVVAKSISLTVDSSMDTCFVDVPQFEVGADGADVV